MTSILQVSLDLVVNQCSTYLGAVQVLLLYVNSQNKMKSKSIILLIY